MKNKIKNMLKSNKFFRNLYENVMFRPIINLYGENFSKRCLLSYSVFPFKQKNKRMIHPNFVENYTLAENLRKHGYIIDVYNNTFNRKIDYSKYNLLVGEGIPISNYYINNNNKNALVIYYATGSHPLVNNFNSQKAILNFANISNMYLVESSRLVDSKWGIGASLADKYIILGNNNTLKTFEIFNTKSPKIIVKPPFYASNIIQDFGKKSSKHFLWFGSYGLIHKDLNTVFDVFLANPQYELHVCGRIEEEKQFMNYYSEKIAKADNIHLHGYIGVNSQEFRTLMEVCSFVILTSCAEGCSTAISTVMGNGGLIPIISKECGFGIKNGFITETANNKMLLEKINQAAAISISDIKKLAQENIKFVNEEYSESHFKSSISDALDIFIEG